MIWSSGPRPMSTEIKCHCMGSHQRVAFASTQRLSFTFTTRAQPKMPGKTHTPMWDLWVLGVSTPSTDSTPHNPLDDAALHLARKVYGTLFSLWKKFFDILADGPDLAKVANPNYLCERWATHSSCSSSAMTSPIGTAEWEKITWIFSLLIPSSLIFWPASRTMRQRDSSHRGGIASETQRSTRSANPSPYGPLATTSPHWKPWEGSTTTFAARYSAHLCMTGMIPRKFPSLFSMPQATDKFVIVSARASETIVLFSMKTISPVFSGRRKQQISRTSMWDFSMENSLFAFVIHAD